MGAFTPEALPVLSGLARGFAVCDHRFSSVPTETFPNRAFACAATSQGHMNDGTASHTVQSIFGLMTAHNLIWKIYGSDEEPLTRKNFPDTTTAPDANFGKFADFTADAAAGRPPGGRRGTAFSSRAGDHRAIASTRTTMSRSARSSFMMSITRCAALPPGLTPS